MVDSHTSLFDLAVAFENLLVSSQATGTFTRLTLTQALLLGALTVLLLAAQPDGPLIGVRGVATVGGECLVRICDSIL